MIVLLDSQESFVILHSGFLTNFYYFFQPGEPPRLCIKRPKSLTFASDLVSFK